MTEFIFYGFAFLLVVSAVSVVFSRNPVHGVLCLIFAFFNAAGLFVLLGVEFLAMLLVIVYVGAVAVLFLFVIMMLRISPEEQPPMFSKVHFERSVKSFKSFAAYAGLFIVTFLVLALLPVVADVSRQGLIGTGNWLGLVRGMMVSKWLIFSDQDSTLYSTLVTCVSLFLSRWFAQTFVRENFLSILSGFFDSLAFLLALGIFFILYFALLGWQWTGSGLAEELSANPTPSTDLMTNTHALGQLLYSDYVFAFQSAGIILLIAMIGAITLTLRRREGVKRQSAFTQINRKVEETLELKDVPLGKGVQF